jgi:hypothetical protein
MNMHRSEILRRPALFLPVLCFATAAFADDVKQADAS